MTCNSETGLKSPAIGQNLPLPSPNVMASKVRRLSRQYSAEFTNGRITFVGTKGSDKTQDHVNHGVAHICIVQLQTGYYIDIGIFGSEHCRLRFTILDVSIG